MLQTVTESRKKPPTNGGQKPTAIEEVFRIIHEQLIDNDGDNSEAFGVALDHIKANRLQKALFDEKGIHIVRGLWNDLAGGREENRHPEPPKQTKGARPKVTRYDTSAYEKWVSLGNSGKSKLAGDLTVPDLKFISRYHASNIKGDLASKAKIDKLTRMLVKSGKERVRDGVSLKALEKLGFSRRQLK